MTRTGHRTAQAPCLFLDRDKGDSTHPTRAWEISHYGVDANVLGNHVVAVPSAVCCGVLDEWQPSAIRPLDFMIDTARLTQTQERTLARSPSAIQEIERRAGLDLLSASPGDTAPVLEAMTTLELCR